MSNIHLELSEQASDLGFKSIEEAEAHGYTVKYSGDEAFLVPDIDKAYKETRDIWENERRVVRADLRTLLDEAMSEGDNDTIKALERALTFVEGVRYFL